MPIDVDAKLDAAGMRLGIVVARWNELITERLLKGALDAVRMHGGDADRVQVFRCPGAFEIPIVLHRLARTERYDALIALGTVIRGATPHFDIVAGNAASGISRVMLESGVPIGFGVLTVDTIEQALERAGTKAGNKGWDAALAAIETAQLLRMVELPWD